MIFAKWAQERKWSMVCRIPSRGRSYLATYLAALGVAAWLFLSCAQSSTQGVTNSTEAADSIDISDTTVWVKERGIVLSPTSRVLLSLLEKYDVPFNRDLVASDFPLKSSGSVAREALMLGVYSVDALYFIYGKDKDAIQRCFFRLGIAADGLGLSNELQLQEMALTCCYANDVETLLPLIVQRLVKLGKALRIQGHEDYYALIAASTWVESTRLLAHIALANNREELYRLVAEQRFLLAEVCDLLSGFVYSTPEAYEAYNQLSTVNGVYGGVQITYSYHAVETDTDRQFSQINATMQFAMSKAQLEAIVNSLETVRAVMLQQK